jgi:hypothetical protein
MSSAVVDLKGPPRRKESQKAFSRLQFFVAGHPRTDATASYSEEEMHAALDINIPNYATAIVTTHEVVDALASVHT